MCERDTLEVTPCGTNYPRGPRTPRQTTQTNYPRGPRTRGQTNYPRGHRTHREVTRTKKSCEA